MATEAWSGSRPVAKAFGAVSSMMYTLGIGTPAESAISWTTFMSWGADCWLTSRAPDVASTSLSPAKYEPTESSIASTIAPVVTPKAPATAPVVP